MNLLVIGKCKDCKNWGGLDGWHMDDDKNFGECKKAKGTHGARQDESSLAFACDFEEYGAKFLTNPDFGCIMFEAKE